ncbi:VanW family protein [Paenibacillus cymbidii]|uniref:hypothetical protein n=1 Tax=Paenibacillus cymbidii TaxID=1639034 RepID=UPI00108093D0|nr:hypothetical protein [Paenibacillus cymbidii]
MRARRRSGASRRTKVVLLGTVLTAAACAGLYAEKPWNNGWSSLTERWNELTIAVAAAAEPSASPNSSPSPSPAKNGSFFSSNVIQNVSNERPAAAAAQVSWVQAVQVKGAFKLEARGKVLADKLNQVEWKAAKRFALLEWMKSLQLQPADQPDADTLSYLASLLYEAAVRLNLQIGDRSLHLQLPAYVSPGFDVYAATGASELSLYNPREFGLKLQLTTDNDVPVLTVLAPEQASWKPAAVIVKQTTYAAEQADVVDRTLPDGGAAPRSDGRDGLLVEVIADGKPVSRDFYLPVPAIVGHGQSPEKQPTK